MTATDTTRTHRGAHALIELLVDPGSYVSWDRARPPVADASYAAELEAAETRSGCDEAVLTGVATVNGRAVVVVASEFGFLGGSIGAVAADRITAAIRRATRERLPVIALPASGGTRMQEGTAAFVRMHEITSAIAAHKRSGLPYVVYLRHPTTGGVFASWGSLGHLTLAEPGALVGFLGPKVYRQLRGEAFPENVQRSEALYEHGVVDGVVAPDDLRAHLSRALRVMSAGTRPAGAGRKREFAGAAQGTAWGAVELTRSAGRPGLAELLDCATDVTDLKGTGEGESAPVIRTSLARIGGIPCVVVGFDRVAQRREAPGPSALRVARRAIHLAEELSLPLVTVVDTPGADLSPEAEWGGLAGEIARTIADLAVLTVPTVGVLLGEGTGGIALALLRTDQVIAAENSWLAALPLEGASTILFGDVAHAPDLAETQHIRAQDLLDIGFVDAIVPEHDDAGLDPDDFIRRVAGAVTDGIARAINEHHCEQDGFPA